MTFHKALEKQIHNLLPEHLKKDPALQSFLNQINRDYEEQDRNKLFFTVGHNLRNGVLLVDSAGIIIDCNDAFLNLTNSSLLLSEAIGMKECEFHSLLNSNFKDPDTFTAVSCEMIKIRKPHFDELVETCDGRFLERDYCPIIIDGSYSGHLWTYRDITARKKTQDEIAQSEFTQRSVLNAAIDAIVIVNEKGLIEFWNKQAEKIFGWSAEDITNYFFTSQFVPLAEIPIDDNGLKQYTNNDLENLNREIIEAETVNKYGEKIFLEVSVVPMNYHNRIYNCAFLRDITRRKQAEFEVVSQKRFREDITNNLPADIAVFNLNHKYLYVNPQGVKDDELRKWLIGKDDFDYCELRGLDTATAVLRRKMFTEALATRQRVQWVDEVNKRDTGEKSYVLRNFYPFIENDEIKYVFGYGIDVTELRSVQIQLSEALDEVKLINEELEQFAYIISHDLQEPLRMVKSFLQLLEKKIGDKLDDTDRRYIYFANNGAERMKKHIRDLLDYSRIGKKKEEVVDVDCSEVLYELKVLFQLKISETNSNLIIHPLPIIKAIKSGIFHLFQNLVGNALKFAKTNGEKNVVEVGFTEVGKSWQFFVKDNGIGIDPKYFDRIFVIFQRLSHQKDETTGTGIGLAVCKKIVEQLGGKIWVESEPGKGSTFYFQIPKNPAS